MLKGQKNQKVVEDLRPPRLALGDDQPDRYRSRAFTKLWVHREKKSRRSLESLDSRILPP